jgi:hypothetical protein
MTMKNIGGLMILLGAGSIVLGYVGYEFSVLMWVDNWGSTVGWLIRGALILVGAILWLQRSKMEDARMEESDAA